MPQLKGKSKAAPTPKVDTASRAPAGRHFPDHPLPSDHVRFLHGEGEATYRYVGIRRLGNAKAKGAYNKKSVPVPKVGKVSVPKLLGWVDELQGEPDVYLTQADFYWGSKKDASRHRTTSQYLNAIGTLFVDLDTYSSPIWGDASVDAIAGAVLAACDEAGVPRPILISSGRGMYADWALSARLNVQEPANVEKWKRVQNKLMGLLSQFGADSKVSDITRVLRLVGTSNSKTGTSVQVLYDDGARHDLGHLLSCTEHLPAFQTRKGKKLKGDLTGAIGRLTPASGDGAPVKGEDSRKRSRRRRAEVSCEADPAALKWLSDLLRADEPVAAMLPKMRHRHYRIFRDLATVVLKRKGIARGQRDEIQFWMLASRFNAGLYTVDELPYLASQFARLCAEPLNLWEKGMLGSLHDRMLQQVQEQGVQIWGAAQPKVIKAVGAFQAVMMAMPHRQDGAAPQGFGRGYSRPRVYTPSVETVLSRVEITDEEQVGLSILVGSNERRRRRSAANVTPAKLERNEQIRALREQGMTVSAIASKTGLSQSSVYRILSHKGVQKGVSGRLPKTLNLSSQNTILNVYHSDTTLSIRQVARIAGVPVSTAYRVVSKHQKSELAWQDAQLRQQLERNLTKLMGPKEVFVRTPKPLIHEKNFPFMLSSHLAAEHAPKSVPDSYFLSVSNRGVGTEERAGTALEVRSFSLGAGPLAGGPALGTKRFSFAVLREPVPGVLPPPCLPEQISDADEDVDPWVVCAGSSSLDNPFEGIEVDAGVGSGDLGEGGDTHLQDDDFYRDEAVSAGSAPREIPEIPGMSVQPDEKLQEAFETHPYGTALPVREVTLQAPVIEDMGAQTDGDDTPEDLESLKKMILASDVHGTWSLDESRQFEARVRECAPDWSAGKFRLKALQVKLVGNPQMREILAQFYALAMDLTLRPHGDVR